MKQVLLVSGHLAALKSTISKRLSVDLGAIVLNKDDMKEVLGDTIGFSNREENLKLSRATFKMMVKMMVDILKINDLVILESNFKPEELKQLSEVAESKNIRQTMIFLTGEAKILYDRYVKRQPERHFVHTSTGLISFENFQNSMIPFDQNVFQNQSVIYDTSLMTEHLYQDMLNQVKMLLDR